MPQAGGPDHAEARPALLAELTRYVDIVIPDDGIEAKLALAEEEGRPLRVKMGFDPTSPDLHLGHAVAIRLLKAFQDAGHQIVIIIGTFTGLVGDPSGRSQTRPLVTPEQLAENAATYVAQLGRILDESKLEVTRNEDWLGPLPLADFLTVLSYATLGQVSSRDDFRKRTAAGKPIGLHEITYPYLQGYDSVAVRADIEVGGADQLYAFQAARQIQPHYGQAPQCAVMTPLLRGLDTVQKMSKSLGNHIGLTDAPADMFGKLMSIPDELISEYLRLTSGFRLAEIEELEARIASGTNPMEVKLELARNVTALYHGDAAALEAASHFDRSFRRRGEADYEEVVLDERPDVVSSLLLALGAASSRSEARRLIDQGGVSLDDERASEDRDLSEVDLDGTRVKVGKRRRYLVRVKGAEG